MPPISLTDLTADSVFESASTIALQSSSTDLADERNLASIWDRCVQLVANAVGFRGTDFPVLNEVLEEYSKSNCQICTKSANALSWSCRWLASVTSETDSSFP